VALGHVSKSKAKGEWHREKERENREKLKRILLNSVSGVTKTELRDQSEMSRPTVDRHLEDFKQEGNLRREGRRLFWVSNYEREKRIDDFLQYLYILDIQRKQSHERRYEIVDMGFDTVLRDTLTGRNVVTIHMKV